MRPVVRLKRRLSTDLFTQAFYFMNSNRPCLQATKSCVLCLQPLFWEFKTVCGCCGLFFCFYYCLNRQNKSILNRIQLFKPRQPGLSLCLVKELIDMLQAIFCKVTLLKIPCPLFDFNEMHCQLSCHFCSVFTYDSCNWSLGTLGSMGALVSSCLCYTRVFRSTCSSRHHMSKCCDLPVQALSARSHWLLSLFHQ